MTTTAKNTVRTQRSASVERPVVYHGIKIEPIDAKRSATAKALRDALRDARQRSELTS